MHIIYIHQHFSTDHGATGTRSFEMAKKLVSMGVKVTVICGYFDVAVSGLAGPFRWGQRKGLVEGIHIIQLDFRYSNNTKFLSRIGIFLIFALRSCGFVLTKNYDLVIATSTPLSVAIPGIVARWARFKPFIFEVRDLWPALPVAMGVVTNPILIWLMSFLEWLSYKSANRLIGLSPGICNGIRRHGIDEDKLIMVPNGCDINMFEDAEAWRPSNIGDSQFLAVFAGTHGKANGVAAILDAALYLKKYSEDQITILLVGSGSEKQGLIERAESQNLTNIRFMDSIPKKKLAGLLASADVGLQVLLDLPEFYYGTSPNKFFDYLSAGLPVITNYPGWVADLINENGCGFCVSPGSGEKFAQALIDASRLAPPDYQAMSCSAKRMALKTFSRESLASKWTQFVLDCPSDFKNVKEK